MIDSLSVLASLIALVLAIRRLLDLEKKPGGKLQQGPRP
jgi:hypothetical protein